MSMGVRRTELDAVATAHAIRRDFRVIYRGVRGPVDVVPGLRERIDAARLLYPSAVLCGYTAAALHGMAFTAGRPVEIWLPARRSRAGLVIRCGAMPDEDVLEREAMLLTTPARTAIDLARFVDSDDAIAAVDQAVRRDRSGRSMTSVDEIAAYVASHPHLHRGRRVLEVLREVDGRAESPQETHVRLMLHRDGLGKFVPQVEVDGGRRRLDLGAEDHLVAVEYDGRDHGDPGQQALDAARRNSLRQDFGWDVLVITKDILRKGRAEFLRQVRAALTKRGWQG